MVCCFRPHCCLFVCYFIVIIGHLAWMVKSFVHVEKKCVYNRNAPTKWIGTMHFSDLVVRRSSGSNVRHNTSEPLFCIRLTDIVPNSQTLDRASFPISIKVALYCRLHHSVIGMCWCVVNLRTIKIACVCRIVQQSRESTNAIEIYFSDR